MPTDDAIALWLECGAPESFKNVSVADLKVALAYFAQPDATQQVAAVPVSLATLDQLTPQQVFDRVVAHLRKQGQRSVISTGAGLPTKCVYRGAGGRKCAAGCLIADDEYKPDMEGRLWGELISVYSVTSAHVELIEALQTVHDGVAPKGWEFALRRVANEFALDYTAPGEQHG